MEVLYVSKKPTMAKQLVTDAKRPPLVPSEKNNVTRRTRSMDVSSRYRSPTPTKDRRCPSPTVTRIVPISSQLLSRRAVSVERQRSLIPSYPSTPVSDISIELPVTSRRLSTENLWPSTMRSLSVSFQSDAISVPVVKKEKPFVTSPNDRTLRPPSNIAYKQQGETTSVSRKHTPERKRSPLKGKNVSSQSENSKPVDGSHSRIIEQHRWPSRKITLNSMNSSLDLGDRVVRRMSVPLSPTSMPLQKSSSRSLDIGDTAIRRRVSLPLSPSSKTLQESSSRNLDLGDKPVRRRMSLPLSPSSKTLQKSSSDAARLLSSYENGGLVSPTHSEDGNSLTWTSSESPNTLNRTALPRFQPSSAPGSRAASPSRSSLSSSSSSSLNSRGKSPSRRVSPLRGLSPSRGANISCLKSPTTPSPRGLSPSRGANISCLRSPTTPSPRGLSPSRGANNISCLRSPTPPLNSPSRIRQTNTSAQSRSNITSVLSFFADVKKGKKATYIEDVHQLRMLYNRYSQWRFANARSDGVRYIQSLIAEETLYNVWHATSDLRDLVTAQRICLQQQKLEIKLESILNNQIGCLEDWSILEREHISSLAGAIGDLEANTTRLPLTGGTKADLGSLKLAMSSAVDVMQAMESSIRSLHSQMEEMNKLASGLAVIATKEKFLFDKCEDLLASTTVMEIEERSIMAHLIQKKK